MFMLVLVNVSINVFVNVVEFKLVILNVFVNMFMNALVIMLVFMNVFDANSTCTPKLPRKPPRRPQKLQM